MRNSRPQTLDALFTDTPLTKGPLKNMQQRAIALLKLNNAVKGLLPTQLQPWCRVANFRNDVLILEVANASWMMRLRYEQSSLLSALRQSILPSLSSIDIIINPTLMTYKDNLLQPISQNGQNCLANTHKLSIESAKLLRELANRSPEKLRKKLEQLAELAGESAYSTNCNMNE